MDECKPLDPGSSVRHLFAEDYCVTCIKHRISAGHGGFFTLFQGTSFGGRQFLRNRRSNRHLVPLYGNMTVYLLKVSNLRTVDRHLRYPRKA